MGDLRPPGFDGDPSKFDAYRREVLLWDIASNLRRDQKGAALVLRLTGRAKSISQNMDLNEVHQDNGVLYVLDYLQANVRVSRFHYVYETHKKLMSLKRGSRHALGPNGEMVSLDTEMYINEFYSTCGKLANLGVPMNEPLMTLHLLENANLTSSQRELIDTILLSRQEEAFSYDRACVALRQILRNEAGKSEHTDTFLASDEDALTDVEYDPDSEYATNLPPFEILYVSKNGKFFKRFPRRFKNQYYQSQYSSFSKGKAKSRGKDFYGKPGKGYSSSSWPGKAFGKGKSRKHKGPEKGRAFFAESSEEQLPEKSPSQPTATSSTSVFAPQASVHSSDIWSSSPDWYEYDAPDLYSSSSYPAPWDASWGDEYSYYCTDWNYSDYSSFDTWNSEPQPSTSFVAGESRTCSETVSTPPPPSNAIDVEEVNFTLENMAEIMLCVTQHEAIMDTGCTKNVTGKVFLAGYLNELRMRNISFVERRRYNTSKFKFANDQTKQSDYVVKIPVFLGNKRFNIDVHVFDEVNIPLLLSLRAMQEMDIIIYCRGQTISSPLCNIQHLPVRKVKPESNHFLLPLFSPSNVVREKHGTGCLFDDTAYLALDSTPPSESDEDLPDEPVLLSDLCESFSVSHDLSSRRKNAKVLHELKNQKNMKKLHVSWGHCSEARILNAVARLGGQKKFYRKLIQKVIHDCTICHGHAKPRVRTSIGGWTAREPNQVVFTDTTEIAYNDEKYDLILFVDCFSRYTYSQLLPSRQANQIVLALLNYSTQTGSYPQTLFSDNGREFVNALMEAFEERHNIIHRTIVPYKPFFNGVVERKNGVFKEYLRRVIDDLQAYVEHFTVFDFVNLLVKETTHVLNTLPDNLGYSSYYKMFLRSPVANMVKNPESLAPSQLASVSELPDLIRIREEVRNKVQRSVQASVMSEKVVQVLSNRTLSSTGPFHSGEIVYRLEKSKYNKRWSGPYIVQTPVGDRLYIISRHGRHITVAERELTRNSPDGSDLIAPNDNNPNDPLNMHTMAGAVPPKENRRVNPADFDLVPLENEIVQQPMLQNDELPVDAHPVQVQTCPDCGIECEDMEGHKLFCRPNAHAHLVRSPNFSECSDSVVLAVDHSPSPYSVFRDQNVFPERQSKEISRGEQDEFFHEINAAKLSELESWKVHNAVELVSLADLPETPNIIGCRWLLSWKLNPNGSIKMPKARLIALGHQDAEKGNLRTDSPTVSALSLRVFLQLTVDNDYDFWSIDLRTAFLQGDPYRSTDNRVVYLRIPSDVSGILGLPSGSLWKCVKSLYGLIDAPRRFFLRLQACILEFGLSQSTFDSSFYYLRSRSHGLVGMVCCHVDDILFSGTEPFLNNFLASMEKSFSYGTLLKNDIQYCGTRIVKEYRKISVSQHEYVQNINPIPIPRNSHDTTILSEELSDQLRTVVGQIGWLATRSRPDLAFAASTGIMKSDHYCIAHLKNVNKHISNALNHPEVCLVFIPQKQHVSFVCYTDASFGNLPNGNSQGAQLIFLTSTDTLTNTSRRCSLLDWRSAKLQRVTRSTLASETLSLSDGVDQVLYLRNIFEELTGIRIPVSMYCDSRSLVQAIYTDKQHVTEKRLLSDINAVRQSVSRKELVGVFFCPTHCMLADSLTKLHVTNRVQSALYSCLAQNELLLPESS